MHKSFSNVLRMFQIEIEKFLFLAFNFSILKLLATKGLIVLNYNYANEEIKLIRGIVANLGTLQISRPSEKS